MARLFQRFWLVLGMVAVWPCCGKGLANDQLIARPIDGPAFAARLIGIDSDWNITLDNRIQRRLIAAADLISWGGLRDCEGKPQILMADRSILRADVVSLTRYQVTVESRLWGVQTIPAERIRGIVFHPPAEVLQRDHLVLQILAATGSQDSLLLENGDRLDGYLQSNLAVQLGPSASGAALFSMETSGGEITVAHDKVIALTYNPALVDIPQAQTMHALVGLSDGSTCNVDRVVPTTKGLQLYLSGRMRLDIISDDSLSPYGEITYLRPTSPRVQYLSNLAPIGYKHVPFLELSWPYGIDQNVLGGRLRAGGRLFEKGLGLHSASRLAYQLDGRYQRFEAELAIDDAAGHRGSVVCHVLVSDSTGQWKTALTSEVIRGGQPPQTISVDIADALRLVLLVDFADHGDVWDHANWLSARLIKKSNAK